MQVREDGGAAGRAYTLDGNRPPDPDPWRRAERRMRPRQSHVFFQDDPNAGVYRIVSGLVTVYRLMSDGRRQVQAFAGPGDVLGLGAGAVYDLSAEAVTDLDLRFFPRTAFDAAMRCDAGFRAHIFELFRAMLGDAREQAVLLGRMSARERTAHFLTELYARQGTGAGPVDIPMRRGDIADYLGLTLETVSRMIHALKQAGVIDLPRPQLFVVRDLPALRRIAGVDELAGSQALDAAIGF